MSIRNPGPRRRILRTLPLRPAPATSANPRHLRGRHPGEDLASVFDGPPLTPVLAPPTPAASFSATPADAANDLTLDGTFDSLPLSDPQAPDPPPTFRPRPDPLRTPLGGLAERPRLLAGIAATGLAALLIFFLVRDSTVRSGPRLQPLYTPVPTGIAMAAVTTPAAPAPADPSASLTALPTPAPVAQAAPPPPLDAIHRVHEGERWADRVAAAVELAASHDPAAVPALARALAEDTDWAVRAAAADALGAIRAGREDLARAADSDPEPAVRDAARLALSELP